MSDDALFGDDGLRVAEEETTAGERLRRRQAARIIAGIHPLSTYGVPIPLHPDAPRDASLGDGREYPRCGTCIHRRLIGGHARDFPKCLAGTTLTVVHPRATRGEATDVRAWWPACVDYQPKAAGS